METLVKKLDLDSYIKEFNSFLARPKAIPIEGDTNLHYRFIKALALVEFPPPPKVPNFEDYLLRLSKEGVLHLDEIYNFVKVIEYFNKLRVLNLPEPLFSWLSEINIPSEIEDICSYFSEDGELNSQKEPELYSVLEAIKQNRVSIKESLLSLTNNKKLQEFLVDNQIHLQNGEETLLVRGGFSSVIKATVVGRSSGGFFYILPSSISKLKDKEAELLSQKEAIYWRYAKEFSKTLNRWLRFLKFLDREFDRFDSYQARVNFAKSRDFNFILPSKTKEIILSEFAHPAIEKPKPITIEINKPIVLITGVNAGGKTMLLKSILASVFMSKYLLPFRCNPSKTKIGRYKNIEAIIDDPQSVKNDISTFAGRMVEFSKLFREKDALVGVDEIELGTDADEASSLFRVLLEELSKRDISFIVTTHHKRLASLLAGEDRVELIAALFDEKNRRPTFEFLTGTIGKSYAFESALRYGIPENIVAKAKEYFGEDKEKLNELIERSSELEISMRKKISELERLKAELERKERSLEESKERLLSEQKKLLATLENRYNAATKRALLALKEVENAKARQLLNEAHRHKSLIKSKKEEVNTKEFRVGNRVKYRSLSGEIISLKEKEALIEADGIRMRVPLKDLTLAPITPKKVKAKRVSKQISVDKSSSASVSIKLLGKRADEAIDELDSFINRALLHGISEVEIIHGIGSGVLAKVVSQFLREHPRVKEFYRAKGNMGATIAKL